MICFWTPSPKLVGAQSLMPHCQSVLAACPVTMLLGELYLTMMSPVPQVPPTLTFNPAVSAPGVAVSLCAQVTPPDQVLVVTLTVQLILTELVLSTEKYVVMV